MASLGSARIADDKACLPLGEALDNIKESSDEWGLAQANYDRKVALFSKSFLNATIEIQKLAANDFRRGGEIDDALKTVREVCSLASEYFELVEQDIYQPRLAQIGKSRKTQLPRFTRAYMKAAKLVCNKPKHDNYFLLPTENTYADGVWVLGFSLGFATRNRAIELCKELHQNNRAISLPLFLRETLANFLRVDDSVARDFSPGEPRALSSWSGSKPMLDAIRGLASMPKRGLAAERQQMIDDVWEEHDRIEWGKKIRTGEQISGLVPGPVKVAQTFRGDGFTRSFPLT